MLNSIMLLRSRKAAPDYLTAFTASSVALFLIQASMLTSPIHCGACTHTLWIVGKSTPRLAFLSPEPGSGKSRALEVTALLVPNPVTAINVSPAYLFRKVGSDEGVTILYDEIDTVFGPKARDNEEVRALLNAGHRRGAVAGRCVVRGNIIETEEIPAYCAVALAGLGWLPDTIISRSVVIRMRRRHDGERVEPFRPRIHTSEGDRVRDSIASWARLVTVEWPDLPTEIQDRDADVWEPLIAIADAIGGKWPARARVAAVALVLDSREGETSLGVRLLADLRTIFENEKELTSKTILDRLMALPEAPWGDVRGKPLDERGLAKRLRAYEVKPKVLRTDVGTLRGYCRADIEDQWRRYVPPSPARSETSKTSETTSSDDEVEPSVSDVSDVSLVADNGGERCIAIRAATFGSVTTAT